MLNRLTKTDGEAVMLRCIRFSILYTICLVVNDILTKTKLMRDWYRIINTKYINFLCDKSTKYESFLVLQHILNTIEIHFTLFSLLHNISIHFVSNISLPAIYVNMPKWIHQFVQTSPFVRRIISDISAFCGWTYTFYVQTNFASALPNSLEEGASINVRQVHYMLTRHLHERWPEFWNQY